jgi:hypothetical protein
VKEGLINLDFADVRAVMREMGSAMMGTGEASGDRRARLSAEAAIANPLIYDVSMRGARGVLISITGGKDLTLYEVDEAATRIREEVDADANIIVGATFDESLVGIIRVSVVATGVDITVANNVRAATSSRPSPRPETGVYTDTLDDDGGPAGKSCRGGQIGRCPRGGHCRIGKAAQGRPCAQHGARRNAGNAGNAGLACRPSRLSRRIPAKPIPLVQSQVGRDVALCIAIFSHCCASNWSVQSRAGVLMILNGWARKGLRRKTAD